MDRLTTTPIASPCTGVCTIDPVTALCMGCARTLDEIAGWSAMTPAARAMTMAALAGRRGEAGRSS